MARRLGRAGFAGSHQTTVSRIEKGERPVNLLEAYTIADVFGITIDQLAGREPVTLADGASGLREAIQILTEELERRQA
jgi:transcriptional regulator with XRE-family HTH domain